MDLHKLSKELALRAFSELHTQKIFEPGKSHIPVTGKYFGAEEIEAGIKSVMDFWLTAGPKTKEFESRLAKFIGVRNAFMVNSGSSANLVAFSALTSKSLGKKAIKPGDEVITAATGFPTTVTPILQNGCVPVYVDIELGTYVSNLEQIKKALSPKTKAVMMAHTLGNPFELGAVSDFCKKNELWLIEDSCDALGSTYGGKQVGTFGDLATLSFYPAHHITTGEGGAVLSNKAALKPLIESFRDWGRDCWCDPGCDNTCLKRFQWELGDLPYGYDHKYTYSHLGYNLKSGDIQAAIGLAQLDRVEKFIEIRKRNWNYLYQKLESFQDLLILPQMTPNSEPSWFGFAISVRPNIKVSRNEIVKKLNEFNIGTRLLFGGNLLRQPAFKGTPQRIVGTLENSDYVTEHTFWIGVWPGLTIEMLDFVVDKLEKVIKGQL